MHRGMVAEKGHAPPLTARAAATEKLGGRTTTN